MYVPRAGWEPMPNEEPSSMRFLGSGMELAGAVVGMALLGYAFDHWRGTGPWGTVIGSMLGLVGGLYNLIKTVIRDDSGTPLK